MTSKSIADRLPRHIKLRNADASLTMGAIEYFCQEGNQWAMREKIRTFIDPDYKPKYTNNSPFTRRELQGIIELIQDIYNY